MRTYQRYSKEKNGPFKHKSLIGNGEIEDYIDALRTADNTAKMKEERV